MYFVRFSNKCRLPNTAKGSMTNSTQTPLSGCTSNKGSCGCTYAVDGRQQSQSKQERTKSVRSNEYVGKLFNRISRQIGEMLKLK